ncbi:asparagine synthase (glutamine-hydrolyzing) [Nemorincola caseinilytica]|uniref:asparagine synthase (glutamine-hydrolyzing) n=1 Tax=Nemorincola caseinilytica TaxID=2054315 RepID=A0ABP8NFI3_9BACT
MCGILSIVGLHNKAVGSDLIKAAHIIRHRGPDDEGYLTWSPSEEPSVWAGDDTAPSTRAHLKYSDLSPSQPFRVGMGHRRLSILDLSPAGHQPMLHRPGGLALSFNGEIYNYLEIKAQLEGLGHTFRSTSDTEVILHAWQEWGPKCINEFNGMFAFVLLDYRRNELYAVRDRFGVKPLFYYKGANALYLASEIKQIRTSPDHSFSLNEGLVRQFLATGAAEHTTATMHNGIMHLPGGHYLRMDLNASGNAFEIVRWYTLQPKKWQGSYDDAAEHLKALLTDAVRLRLRSDVKVGSALSGGLDSSSIVCIMAQLLEAGGDHSGQETVTACFENARFDEWKFAQEVIKQTNARPHRVFPSFADLQRDMDRFLWHQDEPVGSTSIYSQWSVFRTSHEAGLKVMIDGQGADEQLAGYGGNDIALYTGLLRKLRLLALMDEARAYKKEKGAWPVGFLMGAARLVMGRSVAMPTVNWLNGSEPASIHAQPAHSLQDNLLRQVYGEPLPALLRYEDRNSMAWSVESRTPFMDYRLLEFTLGLPEEYVYRQGERKTILRRAMRGILPQAIEQRKDKMGFVTPEEIWLKEEGKEWFRNGIHATLDLFPALFDRQKTLQLFDDVLTGRRPFDFTIWRILVLGRWYDNVVNRNYHP